jgi:hypothetical protein
MSSPLARLSSHPSLSITAPAPMPRVSARRVSVPPHLARFPIDRFSRVGPLPPAKMRDTS